MRKTLVFGMGVYRFFFLLSAIRSGAGKYKKTPDFTAQSFLD